MRLAHAVAASFFLAEKTAELREESPLRQTTRERQALIDFDAFGCVKAAGIEELMTLGKKPLAWGLGLGIPALGVGHTLLRDARHQGEGLIRDARNQALLTAAGVGGMQGLGSLLQAATRPRVSNGGSFGEDPMGKLAADIMVDDLLEDACTSTTAKQAALTHLIIHRMGAMQDVRALLR